MTTLEPQMEVKQAQGAIDADYEWSSTEIQYKWDSWLYGMVGVKDLKAADEHPAKPKPGNAPVYWGELKGNGVSYSRDARGELQDGEIKRENDILEAQIEVLNKYFHELYGDMKNEWTTAEAKVKNFLFSDEIITGHMYCEEISIGNLTDERDCWLVITDKRVIIWRDESCEHDTSGSSIQQQEVLSVSSCDIPTIPNYVKFIPRTYPKTNDDTYKLQDMNHKQTFPAHLTDTFGIMQCTKLRHSDMFFYSIPVGQIRGVNLDWKTATLTGHYRVDLNEGEKAKILNSCQCHCFICGTDCCAKCNCCSKCSCDCFKCCGGSCMTCPKFWCHVHPINCYRGCVVKVFRLCCVPLKPFCDNPVCRLLCCARFIPSCWRRIDEECIQTCCTSYKVGVLRRMDIFRVQELLGNYKFNDNEARFEYEANQDFGVIDTLKGTKHFIRLEYSLLNNGPMYMLKARAGNKLGANEAIPIVKMCAELQYKTMTAPTMARMV